MSLAAFAWSIVCVVVSISGAVSLITVGATTTLKTDNPASYDSSMSLLGKLGVVIGVEVAVMCVGIALASRLWSSSMAFRRASMAFCSASIRSRLGNEMMESATA